MGLLDRFLGGSGEEEDDGFDDEEFESTDFDEEDDEEWEEWDDPEDEEEELQEWDTAYKFLDDALQARGFSGANEFVAKAMVYRINKSPRFRDRFKVGNETMQMVTQTMGQMEQLQGGDGSDYEQLANELQSANKLIDEVDKFSDEEDQMVWELTNLASEFMDVYADKKGGGSGGTVQTGTKQSEQPL